MEIAVRLAQLDTQLALLNILTPAAQPRVCTALQPPRLGRRSQEPYVPLADL